MTKSAAWYSTKQSVYHNNTACHVGNNIEKENLKSGTGGHRLCKICANLNSRKK